MTSRMASSTPKLSDVARHVVYPRTIATTAWPRVVAKCRELGVEFDSWQHGAGTIALGKDAAGKYAATVGGIVLSIPRQVGKTFLVGMIVIALCLIHPGLTVLWSAHRTRTATKTFQSLKGMTSRPKCAPHMLEPRNANGEQEIRFRNGSVIMFGAREAGFGRGFDEVDVEVFDEAQILTEKALEDMVAAANQSRQEAGALLFFMGTPPRPTDPGEEFTNRRRKALAGTAPNMVYVEFSADDDADPDDRKQWAKANPSFPYRTPLESMLRMREQLTSEGSFRREALGIWDEDAVTPSLISPKSWAALRDPDPPDGVRSFAVKFSPSGDWASLAVAVKKPDGGYHVEHIDSRSLAEGHGFFLEFIGDVWRRSSGVLFDGLSDAKVFYQALRERRVPDSRINLGKRLLTVTDAAAAYSGLCEAVRSKSVTNAGQEYLDRSVRDSMKRLINKVSGSYGFAPMHEGADSTPVEACALALYGAMNSKIDPTKKRAGMVML